ncbi:MAG: hypothetical protein COB67_00090 [SAR324 cluster bacterium]|uniref:Uncharacterized protein n=1 Tax=SAR324 cluster bacterium TaxID=2024889 RepID=A0A2A4TBI2_9DELT|nr:MAG: hypothetical protein COB67_00090 [SAR324 cluster bacterium]
MKFFTNTIIIEPTTIMFHTKMRSLTSIFDDAQAYWEWFNDNEFRNSVEIIKSLISLEVSNFCFNTDTDSIEYSNVLKKYALFAPIATKIASDPFWIDEVVLTNFGNVKIPFYLNVRALNIADMLILNKIEFQLDSSMVCTYNISSGNEKVLKDKDGSYFQEVVEDTVTIIIDSVNDQLTVINITCTEKQMIPNYLNLNNYYVSYEHFSSGFVDSGNTDSILATSFGDALQIASLLHDSPEDGIYYSYEAYDKDGNQCESGRSNVSYIEAIENPGIARCSNY